MARKPLDYWEKRQTELMQRLEKGTENTIKSLIQSYEQATKNINKEMVSLETVTSKYDVIELKDMLKERLQYLSTGTCIEI